MEAIWHPHVLIPIGGVQEIGKSTLIIEHDNYIIVIIDAGIKFADTCHNRNKRNIIPDYKYLKEMKG